MRLDILTFLTHLLLKASRKEQPHIDPFTTFLSNNPWFSFNSQYGCFASLLCEAMEACSRCSPIAQRRAQEAMNQNKPQHAFSLFD